MLATLKTIPNVVRPATNSALFDIATLVNAVYQLNIEPTQAGKIPKRIATKLRPLVKGEPRLDYNENDDYIQMMLVLMQNMRIVQTTQPALADAKPRIEPGSYLPQWAQMNMREQTTRLLEQWAGNLNYLDVAGIEYDPWEAYSYYYQDTLKGRKALLNQLRTCTAGDWYSTESCLKHIYEEEPKALRQAYGYITKEQRKQKEPYQQWRSSDGEMYLGMLYASLYEIGIVELGFDKDPDQGEEGNNPIAFMLTDLGAAALAPETSKGTVKSDEPETQALIVQPSFEILLLHPDLPTLYSVLPFTQVNQISTASRLALTQAALLRGLKAGKNVELIVRTLQEHSQKELPQNVIYTLYDWAKQYKEVRVSSALLFEVPNEAIANQICSLAKLQLYGIRQIAPCMLVINSDANLRDVKSVLEKEGIVIHLSSNLGKKAGR